MAEFSARLSCAAGCLDAVASALESTEARLESLACLSQDGAEGVVTFSLEEGGRQSVSADASKRLDLRETGASVLQVKVPNRAGCLSQVTTSLSNAGVTIGSLACACSAGDTSGIVSVGLLPRN